MHLFLKNFPTLRPLRHTTFAFVPAAPCLVRRTRARAMSTTVALRHARRCAKTLFARTAARANTAASQASIDAFMEKFDVAKTSPTMDRPSTPTTFASAPASVERRGTTVGDALRAFGVDVDAVEIVLAQGVEVGLDFDLEQTYEALRHADAFLYLVAHVASTL